MLLMFLYIFIYLKTLVECYLVMQQINSLSIYALCINMKKYDIYLNIYVSMYLLSVRKKRKCVQYSISHTIAKSIRTEQSICIFCIHLKFINSSYSLVFYFYLFLMLFYPYFRWCFGPASCCCCYSVVLYCVQSQPVFCYCMTSSCQQNETLIPSSTNSLRRRRQLTT